MREGKVIVEKVNCFVGNRWVLKYNGENKCDKPYSKRLNKENGPKSISTQAHV